MSQFDSVWGRKRRQARQRSESNPLDVIGYILGGLCARGKLGLSQSSVYPHNLGG